MSFGDICHYAQTKAEVLDAAFVNCWLDNSTLVPAADLIQFSRGPNFRRGPTDASRLTMAEKVGQFSFAIQSLEVIYTESVTRFCDSTQPLSCVT